MIAPRAREQLRQERETFDQAKAHDARWFTLRLAMGDAGIGVLLAIAWASGYILLHPASYPPAAIAGAVTTLLTDMLALVVSTFKLVFRQSCTRRRQTPSLRWSGSPAAPG
jgi:hypothetical protein